MRDALARVDDDDWLAPAEAARRLGISRLRARLLRANGHLQGARDPAGAVGYLRASVELERRWRDTASRSQRLRRLAKGLLEWV